VDTLTADAFYFDSYSVYLKSDEAKKNKYGVTFFTRQDNIKHWVEMNLNVATEAIT